MTLYQNSAPGSSFQTYSAPSGLVKIVRSIQGAAPLATYFAPSGLKSAGRPDKFRQWTDKFWNPSGAGQVPPGGGQVLESCLNFFILYPLSLSSAPTRERFSPRCPEMEESLNVAGIRKTV